MELSPEHIQVRDAYRAKIMQYIALAAVQTQLETPMLSIGYDNEIDS